MSNYSRLLELVKKLSNGEYRLYGYEARLKCPRSNDPNYHPKGDHTPSFFVNLKTGDFHCFGCGYSGGLKKFLKLADGDYYPEIEEIESELYRYRTKKKQPKKIKKEIELPPAIVPTWIRKHKKYIATNEYLKKRNVPAWICRKLRLYVCKANGFLKNAIIFPIEYKDYKFWGARITNPDYTEDTKYFYPEFSPKERVLYNFDWYKKYDTAIIVEGIFDYIRLLSYGYVNTIPLFGLYISEEYQIADLLYHKIRKLYILLDSEATENAVELGQKTSKFFEVFLCKLDHDDPDLSTEDEIENALKNATYIHDIGGSNVIWNIQKKKTDFLTFKKKKPRKYKKISIYCV